MPLPNTHGGENILTRQIVTERSNIMSRNKGKKKAATKAQRQQTPKPQPKAARRRSRAMRQVKGESLLGKHLRMILDPCAAPLTETAYSGVEGQISRFTASGQLFSSTDSTGYGIFVPGGFRDSLGTRLNGATASVLGYGVANVPGYTFLNANSRGARPVAACLRLHWNAAETNRLGSLACGVLPASTFPAGTSPTTDNMYTILSEKGRIPAGECEIIWNPSQEDMTYDLCDSTVTVSNFDDKNALVFAYAGAPNFAIAWTYTVIYEWTPKVALGFMQHSPVHKSVTDPIGTINNALHQLQFKSKPLIEKGVNMLFDTVGSYTGAGMAMKLAKVAAGAVTTLLP